MRQLPPQPIPFPYTTLFRSHLFTSWAVAPKHPLVGALDGPTRHHQVSFGDLFLNGGLEVGEGGTDRKSTRLNSSHITSSYAVFCLKKKTKQPGSLERPECER